ncbi:MAG TPA: endonuclease MutS2 [Longimicrobiaceae bacterium]
MNSHALEVLGYREALSIVGRMASSALGRAAVEGLSPSTDPGWIADELALVTEMSGLLRRDDGWGLPAIPDLHDAIRRLRVDGSVLEGEELRAASVLLSSSHTVRRSLLGQREQLPRLAAEAEPLADLPSVVAAIDRAIDENGEVKDDASPELARLRRAIGGARARIVARLNAYVASLPEAYRVPDTAVTIREGRYVIAIRREGRAEVGGIVHDESGTGATLFVEPPAAIEMMNELREMEAEAAREVRRILRELTASLRPHQEALSASLSALVRLDTVLARARYAASVVGVAPQMEADRPAPYEVVNGRHPLLLARSSEVVPFDLRMDPSERTLVISGPNTGGKTVLLKAIGLISLLAQSGVIPPVSAGTRLPIFRSVYADIGDEQSIEASLSTFSAHLKNLRETIQDADADSLVLIDEIGSGTDPVEGAALARAILQTLTRRGAFTVATTHLGDLKLIATEDERVVNASLQFDAERLEPTYRLLKGVPGRSYGLAIARRLGMPAQILEEAEAALPRGERDVARLLLELEAKEQRAEEAAARLERELAEVRARGEALEQRERQLREREKDAERRARQQARDLLLHARREVEQAIAEVRAAADEAKLEEAARAARRRVEEAARAQRERVPRERPRKRAPEAESTATGPLEIGLRVRILSLGKVGTVVELRDGKAMVETGGLRMLLPREDLSPLPPGDQQVAEKARRSPAGGGYIDMTSEASAEVDLRGLRVDELELALGRALDAALMSGLPSFRVIHGKGMGALRARVQELLRADPRVVRFRPGDRFEGGTGVTVAEFE